MSYSMVCGTAKGEDGKEQTMSRWICVDDICIPSDENDWEELVAFADAVAEQEPIEIVRCGECKYWHKNRKDGDDIPIYDACYDFTADDFCSYGERKESE